MLPLELMAKEEIDTRDKQYSGGNTNKNNIPAAIKTIKVKDAKNLFGTRYTNEERDE